MKRYTESIRGCVEVGLMVLRETDVGKPLCTTPEMAAEYWNKHVKPALLNPDVETLAVLFLNARSKVRGHCMITVGGADNIIVHPREVFRPAIVASAGAIVLMHNHPSGVSEPSNADIKVTRDLVRAGQLLKINVLDHVVMGDPEYPGSKGYSSLKELGYIDAFVS